MAKEEDLYKELLDLSIKAKEIRQRQKEIKFELLEMKELNELENNSFGNQLGKVVIEPEVRYELADLLPEVKIPTSVLNDVVMDSVAMNPPSQFNNGVAKFYYATQVSIEPPTFVIFVNDENYVHFSYARYLENRLRTVFDFEGTPIKIIFRRRD